MPESEEIISGLKTVGIPFAYRQFVPLKGKPVPKPPFGVYYISSESASGADGKNLFVRRTLTVELYADAKDIKLERKIEAVLDSTEWSKYEEYIESEGLYMVSYEVDVFEKI